MRTIAIALLLVVSAAAEDPRLQPPKDLDGYFPFEVPASPQAWEKRAAELRLQMRVALGIHPEPERTPLHAVIHGEIDRGDYSVAKVYFESLPGFFVTGNLYRPAGKGVDPSARKPGVLSPHGHWSDGRFYDNGEANTKAQIERGEEQFIEGGRSPLQARAVGLARLGCVVFHYDMIGYADSNQLSYELAHRHAIARPAMDTKENWGLFSAQAEAHLQSVMGLQTWNSIRALDFLESLDDVDPGRLAVTGGSGGGTQSMLLAALDPRVAVSFPAVMVSTAMQGGCTCENASLLRVATGNVEFAALFAPKPQGMSAANDWTKEMSTKGFPALKRHYALLGAPDKVMLHDRTEFGHNYNQPTRLAMYHWFNKHLALGHSEPISERDFTRLTRAEMSVWDDAHPAPPSGDDFERKLLQAWRTSVPVDAGAAREGFRAIFRRDIDRAGAAEFLHSREKQDRGDYLEMVGTLTNTTHHEEVGATFLYPKDWAGNVVVWVHPDGSRSLYEKDGTTPVADVKELLEARRAIAAIEPLLAGTKQTPKVNNPREFAGYTLGYNDSLFVRRTHDLLTAIRFMLDDDHGAKQIDLLAYPGSGAVAAAANMLAAGKLHRAAIDTGGFRFGDLLDYRDPNFLPGGAKYGDVPMMVALGKAEAVLLDPDPDGPPMVRWLLTP